MLEWGQEGEGRHKEADCMICISKQPGGRTHHDVHGQVQVTITIAKLQPQLLNLLA